MNCQPPKLTTGLSVLKGSWACRLAADASTSANWTLRAIE